ncbi:glycosyltransferase [Halobacterium salinarum]|uniref:glycosyltransferase family 4 protein n=1 Tax=Halobacterium TaxID=2239 RepID=UPI001965A93F|nr:MULTISPECIES: glycosyltransferase [Halobacterium]MCF2164113.1 glycosyltransferase [Halobacterium salinarum]MCF2167811.1 glycosyltransferase [Halobacterium salinarum]MCF2239221.1 glycosyltransferase [Halobacterium salinarum]MDL0140750.1 glycosyltransferase [Halobacterium salinarum]QRY23015.1 glycosyltransferase [Halobacterium sp. GSL-19]
MRVAFVSETTTHHEHGDDLDRLALLADCLLDRGHDVHVCCAQWWDGQPDVFDYDGVTYHAVTPDHGQRWFAPKAAGMVRTLGPDVVHATSRTPGHVYGARWGALLAGAPLVVDWYDTPEAHGGLTGRAYGYAARKPAVVVTPSRTVKTAVREHGGRTDAIRVLPTGIDMDRIRHAVPGGGGDIVCSRRLDGDANVESLFLALAEFREYDWNCTIVGDGPARADYERQARDLRIADRVDFVGDCTVDERVEIFKNAHVYVHTAEKTPFAHDLLRALACGCVGIVEYHAESSAHELIETYPRGFRATSDEEITECLVQAGDLERKAVDESFAEHDHEQFLDTYLTAYADAQAATGLF